MGEDDDGEAVEAGEKREQYGHLPECGLGQHGEYREHRDRGDATGERHVFARVHDAIERTNYQTTDDQRQRHHQQHIAPLHHA
jgi:hypothetical protein